MAFSGYLPEIPIRGSDDGWAALTFMSTSKARIRSSTLPRYGLCSATILTK